MLSSNIIITFSSCTSFTVLSGVNEEFAVSGWAWLLEGVRRCSLGDGLDLDLDIFLS